MNLWISVKEKTPEDYKDVLFTDGKTIFKGCRASSIIDEDSDTVFYFSNERHVDKVTHWMPLPPLPKD